MRGSAKDQKKGIPRKIALPTRTSSLPWTLRRATAYIPPRTSKPPKPHLHLINLFLISTTLPALVPIRHSLISILPSAPSQSRSSAGSSRQTPNLRETSPSSTCEKSRRKKRISQILPIFSPNTYDSHTHTSYNTIHSVTCHNHTSTFHRSLYATPYALPQQH